MSAAQNGQYPYHLMKLVGQRLRQRGLKAPSDAVLLRLFETLFFASLQTDEGRPCRCTLNYIDRDELVQQSGRTGRGAWNAIPFARPFPLDVRTLTKLAEAADATVASLAVTSDAGGDLLIWGLVDQELRYADYVALDSVQEPQRPGLFQATIAGMGNVCVSKDYALLGSLEQNALVDQYHDVLWSGPIHETLKGHLRETLTEHSGAAGGRAATDIQCVEDELLIRWQNAICRILLNIQQYRHGGGLLVVPRFPAPDLNIKYQMVYDRLPQSLVRLVQQQLRTRQNAQDIAAYCEGGKVGAVPTELHRNSVGNHARLQDRRNEQLGCVRFIASLSQVDGCVVLDKSLVVHGFGAELTADSDLTDFSIAGDPQATPRQLRPGSLSQFGTRHRAMMRYCFANPGSVGFVVSQDGDIRAMARLAGRLVLWENIDVQLAFKAENASERMRHFEPATSLAQSWASWFAVSKSA